MYNEKNIMILQSRSFQEEETKSYISFFSDYEELLKSEEETK